MERNQHHGELESVSLTQQTSEAYQLQFVDEGHSQRISVERCIATRFEAVHGARITVFMPLILALFDTDNQVRAAVGVRVASDDRLFLEHYFEQPIEKIIVEYHRKFGGFAARNEVVEVGNLASVDRYASRRLFEQLAVFLINNRFQWMVFTSCRSLRKLFQRMKLGLVEIGTATESSLPETCGSWGSYYSDQPRVMLGHLSPRINLVQQANHLMLQEGL